MKAAGNASTEVPLQPMQDSAGQLRKSPHQFSGIGSQSPLLWLTRGYAVLDGPTMPIVAEGDDDKAEPNDTYVPQLVASARAAVQVCVLSSLTCARSLTEMPGVQVTAS